jgi:hypothetical protein
VDKCSDGKETTSAKVSLSKDLIFLKEIVIFVLYNEAINSSNNLPSDLFLQLKYLINTHPLKHKFQVLSKTGCRAHFESYGRYVRARLSNNRVYYFTFMVSRKVPCPCVLSYLGTLALTIKTVPFFFKLYIKQFSVLSLNKVKLKTIIIKD